MSMITKTIRCSMCGKMFDAVCYDCEARYYETKRREVK